MSHHDPASADEANHQALLRMFEALDRQDWDAAVENVADDFVQLWPQSGERIEGRQHCLVIYRNYPGGGPRLQIRRITGSGDHWTVETTLTYGDKPVLGVSVFDFRDGKAVREVDYFADPFEPPAWRSQWVTVESAV